MRVLSVKGEEEHRMAKEREGNLSLGWEGASGEGRRGRLTAKETAIPMTQRKMLRLCSGTFFGHSSDKTIDKNIHTRLNFTFGVIPQ